MASTKNQSQTYKIAKAKEILRKSEDVLLKVLDAQVPGISPTLRVQVALELYKRRVPILMDHTAPPPAQLENKTIPVTMITVIKNHIPESCNKDTIDVPSTKTMDDAVLNLYKQDNQLNPNYSVTSGNNDDEEE
jgi:hypothetical protein